MCVLKTKGKYIWRHFCVKTYNGSKVFAYDFKSLAA